MKLARTDEQDDDHPVRRCAMRTAEVDKHENRERCCLCSEPVS